VRRGINAAIIHHVAFLAGACGSTAESPNLPADAPVVAVDAPPATGDVDAAPALPGEIVTLVDDLWTLPGGKEGYRCVRKTVTRDMVIDRFETMGPPGTHHTVLTVGDGSRPDGAEDCSSTVALPHTLYVSGVNTPPMELPPRVGMRIRAGEQLLLNLHIFNTSPSPLSGRSGVRARLADPAAIDHEAEAILAGTLSLAIGPGVSTQTGRCRLDGATTIFALAPHMHQLGIHQTVTVEATGDVLLDRDYSFDAQDFLFVTRALPAGSVLRVDCTYDNPGEGTIGWGESSLLEMGFAIVYRYPALERFQLCVGQ
jgi:hypothetical protein